MEASTWGWALSVSFNAMKTSKNFSRVCISQYFTAKTLEPLVIRDRECSSTLRWVFKFWKLFVIKGPLRKSAIEQQKSRWLLKNFSKLVKRLITSQERFQFNSLENERKWEKKWQKLKFSLILCWTLQHFNTETLAISHHCNHDSPLPANKKLPRFIISITVKSQSLCT